VSRERLPLREHLEDRFDERVIQRVWRRVQQRRHRSVAVAGGPAWLIGGALALAAAATLLVARATRPAEPGVLRGLDGKEPGMLMAVPSAAETAVPFEDGSRVVLGPASRATVVENSGHTLVVVLSSGRATFDVHPGGPRRWSIECGLATVEVVGTRFTIDRAPGSVEVSVEHGVVLVRGERVPERLQRLAAGQSLRVGEIGAAAGAAPEPAASVSVAAPPATDARAPAHRVAAVPWRDLVRGSRYSQAYGALGKRGIAQSAQTATPQELLWLADIARLSGHPADAVMPLRRLIGEHPRDPNVPIALFTLGRIQLDSLGDSRAAADAFSRAIAAGVPHSLAEDAAARLVEALARAGDTPGARAAGEEYLRAFPGGRHGPDVRRWIAPR